MHNFYGLACTRDLFMLKASMYLAGFNFLVRVVL